MIFNRGSAKENRANGITFAEIASRTQHLAHSTTCEQFLGVENILELVATSSD